MLDLNFILQNQELIKKALKRRGIDFDLEELIRLIAEKKEFQTKADILRTKRNELSKSMAKDKSLVSEAKKTKEELKKIEPRLKDIEAKLEELLLNLPNIPDDDIPDGKGEAENKVIREWGKPRTFDFKPKDHVALAENLDIIDFKRGAKIAGFGFYYLKNEGALLEFALLNLAIKKILSHGFNLMIVPNLVRKEAMVGSGFFPTDEKEVYQTMFDDLYLIGTAEVSLASFRAGEVLDKKVLPLYYGGFSSCFRREAGAYGAEAKGVFRVHQFSKVEMFVISEPEKSREEHERLVKIAEELLSELELPYRVTLNCTGDLGAPNIRRYDILTWMPGRNAYGETHSASNDGDFQARRLNIRYREEDGKLAFCHTLNNTAIASPRILVALLENYQRSDGSIEVPRALWPYLDFKEIRSKN